ncbi:response regulator [Dokdonella ginsengisoli]|uniref:Response regulator n=1 Tax=Dokdonella ginsengisoli TaxID=363846 RepID=A0ABV9QQL4_9GAMM
MHVLVVEDDELLGAGMRDALARWSHTSVWVRDGAAALAAVRDGAFDLVVLDLGLPKIDGLDVLKTLRQRRIGLPVLVVTARDATPQRVEGLDAGADDYLVKPFHLDEFAARLRALYRRSQGLSRESIEAGALSLDPHTREASYAGRTLELSRTEFLLLRALAERAGRVALRETLERAVYGDDGVESNALEVHVHALRRKLAPEAIRTVRGLGYLLVKEP